MFNMTTLTTFFAPRRQDRKGSVFVKPIDCSGDACFHQGLPKIEQKSKLVSCKTQVRLELLFVHPGNLLNRLELKNHLPLDHDICPECLVKFYAPELNRDRYLSLNPKPALS